MLLILLMLLMQLVAIIAIIANIIIITINVNMQSGAGIWSHAQAEWQYELLLMAINHY